MIDGLLRVYGHVLLDAYRLGLSAELLTGQARAVVVPGAPMADDVRILNVRSPQTSGFHRGDDAEQNRRRL